MKARLAKKEVGSHSGISIKKTMSFKESSLHAHDFYELDIIVGGFASTTLNGVGRKASKGEIYFLTPDDLHDYRGEDTVDVLNVQFYSDSADSAVLSRLISSGHRIFTPTEQSFNAVCELYRVMELTDPALDSADLIFAKLLEAMLMIIADSSGKDATSDETAFPYMQRALIYIQEHFKENPTLTEVAGRLPINERYFCKRFKEYVGMTYKEYLRERKLTYARRLVLSTNMTMTEIAGRCGYGSQSHFNREFKEYFGISPVAMKQK